MPHRPDRGGPSSDKRDCRRGKGQAGVKSPTPSPTPTHRRLARTKDEGCLLAHGQVHRPAGRPLRPPPSQSDNVVIVNNDNRAPMFKENDQEITETTRKVKENAHSGERFRSMVRRTAEDQMPTVMNWTEDLGHGHRPQRRHADLHPGRH